MLPLVRPVASVKSASEVPAYPFLLKTTAVFSIMNWRVRSAFDNSLFTTQIYQSVFYLLLLDCHFGEGGKVYVKHVARETQNIASLHNGFIRRDAIFCVLIGCLQ